MFAVIYKGTVYPESEETYKKLWYQMAKYFIENRGALGSCLHKTLYGEWVAYSRGPDKSTRDVSWSKEGDKPSHTLNSDVFTLIKDFKNCFDKDQPFQEICMEIVHDIMFSRNSTHV